jgi:predicted nucleic acid-binding protein
MPALVDTSVWIHHFRSDSPALQRLLDEDRVLCHQLVIGELACGQLKHRTEVLQSLTALPPAPILEFDEVLAFLEAHKLFGLGLGWIDVHLLASTLLADVTLWTLDGPLQRAAKKLHCSYPLSD